MNESSERLTYKETQQLFETTIRVAKADSAFVYFILESNEGLSFYSTLEHNEGDLFRDILIHSPIEHRDEVLRQLDYLRNSFSIDILEQRVIQDTRDAHSRNLKQKLRP
jgi:hypothetical protein